MSHKSKECLKVQANRQLNQLCCLGRSKYEDKKIAEREYDTLASKDISKQEYINNAIRDKIYSYNTYATYEKHINYFLKECEAKGCKTLAECRQYVTPWLNSRINQGLSAYTVSVEASALAKLYQVPVTSFSVDIPTRNRENISRSRGNADRDRGFSLEKNKEIINFCRGTGLRRSELASLRTEQLHFRNNEPFLTVCGKGGRVRDVAIVGNHRDEIVARIQTANGRVWPSIPSHMDVHSYRSDYATAIYKAYERDNIPQKDKYFCRGDRKGEVLDKQAMKMASEALGHSRLEVVAGHYIR